MDELVHLVAQKTGLSEDAARQAAQVILVYLKGRLSPDAYAQVDAALSSGGGKMGMSGGKSPDDKSSGGDKSGFAKPSYDKGSYDKQGGDQPGYDKGGKPSGDFPFKK
ncbi:MAG: hypothetical protein U0670_13185 [Anaerolineae bacterium]